MKHKYLDTEQPWEVIALLALFCVAIGVGVASLTSNVIIAFISGVLVVILGTALIERVG
jgi:hypothetical protein